MTGLLAANGGLLLQTATLPPPRLRRAATGSPPSSPSLVLFWPCWPQGRPMTGLLAANGALLQIATLPPPRLRCAATGSPPSSPSLVPQGRPMTGLLAANGALLQIATLHPPARATALPCRSTCRHPRSPSPASATEADTSAVQAPWPWWPAAACPLKTWAAFCWQADPTAAERTSAVCGTAAGVAVAVAAAATAGSVQPPSAVFACEQRGARCVRAKMATEQYIYIYTLRCAACAYIRLCNIYI